MDVLGSEGENKNRFSHLNIKVPIRKEVNPRLLVSVQKQTEAESLSSQTGCIFMVGVVLRTA